MLINLRIFRQIYRNVLLFNQILILYLILKRNTSFEIEIILTQTSYYQSTLFQTTFVQILE